MWSWYLQGGTYVGMAALRGIRIQPDASDWWVVDRRDEQRKARAFGPFTSSEAARDAAVRKVAA